MAFHKKIYSTFIFEEEEKIFLPGLCLKLSLLLLQYSKCLLMYAQILPILRVKQFNGLKKKENKPAIKRTSQPFQICLKVPKDGEFLGTHFGHFAKATDPFTSTRRL